MPDTTMPGRLMLAGGLLWLTVKPAQLPGDRYELIGIVLNLTGSGNATRQCVLSTAEWTLKPIEVNVETLDAGELLVQIVAGAVPKEMLAMIPLMRRGGEPDIIQRWNEVVDTETDLRKKADYALARLFAERVGHKDAWHDALKGLSMIESPLIAELLAEAVAEAAPKIKAEAVAEAAPKLKADALLRVLQRRYRELPEELVATVRACVDGNQLDRWLDLAGEAETLAQFRQQAAL